MAKQGNIIVLIYNPKGSEIDVDVPEKIEYDSKREKMTSGKSE